MVNAFNALYPTMSFFTLIKWGGLKFSGLQVRGKGDCSSFGLLGRCPGCTYNHMACTVSTDRQAAINEALKLVMATLKKGTLSATWSLHRAARFHHLSPRLTLPPSMSLQVVVRGAVIWQVDVRPVGSWRK